MTYLSVMMASLMQIHVVGLHVHGLFFLYRLSFQTPLPPKKKASETFSLSLTMMQQWGLKKQLSWIMSADMPRHSI